MRYPRLFEACKIGGLDLSNRIVMPPMTTLLARNGSVTDGMVEYYAERARGGVGLIVVEDAIVDTPLGNHTPRSLANDDDRFLPGLRRLAQAIHAGGAKALLNLNHAGRRSGKVENGQLPLSQGKIPIAPSAIPHPVPGYVVPREMSLEEVEELEEKFVQAACRAREAGFDGVSLHGAHMYLIGQFLSPLSNRRQDQYGGDLHGRLRFLKNIVRRVKERLGRDCPVMVRINSRDGLEGGLTIEDAKKIAPLLEEGGVDLLSLSCGTGVPPALPNSPRPVAPMRLPHGLEVQFAAQVKQTTAMPVLAANRIVTPREAEDILKEGRADFIGIGRGLIADPFWPRKAQEGREDEIRFCIGCVNCFKRVGEDRANLRCTVNPAAGQESECRITPSAQPKVVFIAGGGPAGLEAARVSALRGHKPRLFEKRELGGQLRLAWIPPGKGDMRLFFDFEERELNKLGVQIERLALTPEIISREKPEAVIVATGSSPMIPPLPGIDGPNVATSWQVLAGERLPGHQVVVLGGGMVGAETAEHLAAQSRQVTIVEMVDQIAAEMERGSRHLLIFSLEGLGVTVRTRTTAREITDQGVWVERKGRREFIPADTVVLALGVQPDRELAERLEKEKDVFIVGDCAEIGRLPDAVEGGYKAALKI